MKEWPKDGTCVMFSDLAGPLRKVLRFGYILKRKNGNKDIPWDGYNIGKKELSTCLNPEEALTAESLAFAKEDQGCDLLDAIITIAIQLGIEQGRRMERKETKERNSLKNMTEMMLFEQIEQLWNRLKIERTFRMEQEKAQDIF